MAHKEMQDFCNNLKKSQPDYFKGVKVIDIGSLNVNGTNKHLFEDSDYRGLDILPGDNVDIVSVAHEYKTREKFDVVCSTEALEHDMYWFNTLTKMLSLCKKGGLVFFTCATTGREEHGTVSAHPGTSPNTISIGGKWATYYKNLTKDEIDEVLRAEDNFSEHEYIINEQSSDLYFWGFKK